MWIFGQVWFACLVGFAVGVLLDWALRVRPLARRVAELESRVSDRAGERGATRVTDYGRTAFAEPDPGFEPERPSRSGLSADLLDRPDDDFDRDRLDRTRAGGLSEATRLTPAVSDFSPPARDDSWEPSPPEEVIPAREPWRPERSEDHWHPNSLSAFEQEQYEEQARRDAEPEPPAPPQVPAAEKTSVYQAPVPVIPPTDADADEQYLDFLRSSAGGDQSDDATSVLSTDRDDRAAHAAHADPADLADRAEDDAAERGALSLSGDHGSGEVTSIMPAIPADEPVAAEPTSVFQPYTEPRSEPGGYRDDYIPEYQPEEGVQEPENPTPLPRRGPGHSTMPRFSPFSPSFDDGETELSSGGPARITPIAEDGFMPFGTPVEEDPAEAWQGGDDPAGAPYGKSTPYAESRPYGELPPAPMGEPRDGDGSSWFDLPAAGDDGAETPDSADAAHGDHALTQRMPPVTSNGVHPPVDLPPTATTYAEPAFHEYEGDYDDGTDQGPARSLFEPVIAPDVSEELPKRKPMLPVPPRPVRVRTGMGRSAPPRPRPRPEESAPRPDQDAEDRFEGPSADATQVQQPPRSYQPYDEPEPTQYVEPAQHTEPTQYGEPTQYAEPGHYGESTHDPQATTQLPPVAPPRDTDDDGWSGDHFGGSGFGGDLTGDLTDEPAPPAGPGFNQGGPNHGGPNLGGFNHGGQGGDPQMGPFGPGSALPLPDGSAPSPQFTVKARTSSMVFHTESSPFYDRLEPQVWFRDPADAQRAGFTSWERPRTW
jgi:hypothetical protein